MMNLPDRWVSIDLEDTIRDSVISQAKRGSKRFCGRIINNRRDGDYALDLFFDSTSPVIPWNK